MRRLPVLVVAFTTLLIVAAALVINRWQGNTLLGQTGSSCPNTMCDANENSQTCPQDCPWQTCWDCPNYGINGSCTSSQVDYNVACLYHDQNSCNGMCDTCPNTMCEANENSQNCPQDCPLKTCWTCQNQGVNGSCTSSQVDYNFACLYQDQNSCKAMCNTCGNNMCEANENSTNCLQDCPKQTCWDCQNQGVNGSCTSSQVDHNVACTYHDQNSCMSMCNTCGNNMCDPGENSTNCAKDCGKCGDGKKGAEEECDGGVGCKADCTCPISMKADFAGGCMCDPVSAGTTQCCEDLDANNDGVVEDPREAQITRGLGEKCSGFICIWCEQTNAQGVPSCSSGIGPQCGSCPDEDGNYDPGCRCESPDLNGCDATYCTAPYTGDCDDRCSLPGEKGCYVVNDDGKRVKVGMYTGSFQCFNDVCAIPRSGGTSGGYSGGTTGQGGGISNNTGGAAGADGGGDSGDGGDGGDNGGSNSSNSNGQSSSSSSKDCNDTNPCVAATVVNGNLSYTVPASCPLEGNQEVCYTQCIDTINRTRLKIDCNAQCGVDDGDLKMCPCNPDNQQCVLGCMTGYMACGTSCGNNQTCRSQCSTQYRSCLDGCGRACPASSSGSNGSNGSNSSNNSNSSKSGSSNTSKGGSSSSRSGSSTSNGSNGSNNSNGSNSSQGSQNSSGSNRSGSNSSVSNSNKSNSNSSTSNKSSSSQGSNTSGSTSSTSNHSNSHQSSSTSSLMSGVCCEEGNCNPFGTCSNPFESYKICKATCGTSSSSNRSNISQSSSTSSLKDGICCEAGNCNPFGKCANPYDKYAQCLATCGLSSRSSSSNSFRSSSSTSSLSSYSSSSHHSSTSSSRSSSSYKSSQSSSAFSDDQHSSQRSNGLPCSEPSQCASGVCINGICTETSSARSIGLPCTDASQCASGACVNGICIDSTSSRITAVPRPRSSVSNIACLIDGDCPSGTRCILNRCLTVTEIAQLPPFCGNARPDAGEQCDLGAENSDRPNAYCRPDCTLGRCGDGIIDTPLELCDDGNVLNNDGCSAACLVERTAPPTTLPATTIELPFVNKGDLGMTPDNTQGGSTDVGGQSQTGVPSSVPSTPDTGPAALAIMIAGGAAGWLYRRRK